MNMCSKNTRSDKKLSTIQRQALVGLLLGDGNLQTESNGRTFRLRVCQSLAHKDYVFHLYELFKDFTTSPPVESTEIDERTGQTYLSWSFSTTQQSCFRYYGQQFYDKKRVKRVPPIIARLLKPRSIAYWYMDDGAQKWKNVTKGVRFCTDNFQRREVKLLAKTLKDKYQLKTSLQKQRKDFRIYVSTNSYETLKKLIWEYFIPSMLYKFPL